MTSGAAVLGLGALGLVVAFATEAFVPQDLGFIDVPAMALFSALFVFVGGAMIRTGYR